ncbi:MAG: dTDP-4-dehydrorhamnose 3,5-epimerase [Lachnospiraceae bacterium]|nr:dTDP-4-dehydrorhamnose 3,5-epimerase [Lachnospiraceae bacterium]
MGQIKVTYDLYGIAGLCAIESAPHSDSRGYFMETFNQKDMYEAGLYVSFVQDNQVLSRKGVLRGLHFQKRFPQTKLVRVIRGTVYDVAVDLRRSSPTFGKYHGEILSANNLKQYLIPRGFAHGYLVLSEEAEICYKCDDYYHADDEGGLAWNDPEIGIEWPFLEGVYQGTASAEGYRLSDGSPLILAEKDRKWPGLQSLGR